MKTRKWFSTLDGVAVPAVTTEEMRAIDRIAMSETGPNLFQMMEHAGLNFALMAIEHLGMEWQSREIVVLAGSGGNGGGGICAARHLASRGAHVTLVVAGGLAAGSVPADQHHVYRATRGREIPPNRIDTQRPALILDALIGYGLAAAPTGITAELIAWMVGNEAPVLSLDVPSGVDATSGEAPGVVVRPHTTLTLALPKCGLTPANAGVLVLADLGLPALAFERAGVPWVQPFGARARVPLAAAM